MPSWVGSLFGPFERLLRWIYPGSLFLLLLGLSRPSDIERLEKVVPNNSEMGAWLLIGGVMGAVLYLIQAHVIGEAVSVLAQILRWEINCGTQVPERAEASEVCCVLRPFAKLLDRQAASDERRWPRDKKEADQPGSHLDYAWASYHAASVTGWLTLLRYSNKQNDSIFDRLDGWVVMAPAILLLLGSLWIYGRLSRIKIPPRV